VRIGLKSEPRKKLQFYWWGRSASPLLYDCTAF